MIAEKIRLFSAQAFLASHHAKRLDSQSLEALQVVSRVLPFRVNEYVLNDLIDWDRAPDDPIFRLVFPHRDMLHANEYAALLRLLRTAPDHASIAPLVERIRWRMNPHPAGQTTHNVPWLQGRPLKGLQHKYEQTVLFFPAAGQTCHAYCTFCFRWPQFVAMEGMKFDTRESTDLLAYLAHHPEISDVLITGGDPMIMSAEALTRCIQPLLHIDSLKNIRIGTKALAYWPQRFVSDPDSDAVLQLFEKVVDAGKSLSLMAHYTHPAELRPPVAQKALRRVIETGATVRIQSPLVRHVNDDAQAWTELWTTGVRLGAIPYYLFVERDTGAHDYFKVPLVQAATLFQNAYQKVSGLARTVRGPSMSTLHGKVLVNGLTEIQGEQVFALQFLQARKPEWVGRPFFARFDTQAAWMSDLQPAFGERRFFFETPGDMQLPPLNHVRKDTSELVHS
ncbi:MAG: hypothetical protein RL522_69 [Pseudomonadota bacterium]